MRKVCGGVIPKMGGRPWGTWKVRELKFEYQIDYILCHPHKSISAGFQSEDSLPCSWVQSSCSRDQPFLWPFPWMKELRRRMHEWGSGG